MHHNNGTTYVSKDHEISKTATEENGDLRLESFAEKEDILELWRDSLDLDDNVIEYGQSIKLIKSGAENLIQNEILSSDDHKVLDSLHWNRKAAEAESKEDSLLWYWISLENLLNKNHDYTDNWIIDEKDREDPFTLASEILPRIRCTYIAYNLGWDIFFYLERLLSSPFSELGKKLSIPEDIKEKSNLNIKINQKQINLKPFIDTLPEIIQCIPDGLLQDQLKDLNEFYDSSEYALGVLKKEFQKAQEEVTMLYRMRNKIVHNAQYDSLLLPFFVDSAKKFSFSLMDRVLVYRNKKNMSDVRDIMIHIYSTHNLIIENLSNQNPKVCFLDKDIN